MIALDEEYTFFLKLFMLFWSYFKFFWWFSEANSETSLAGDPQSWLFYKHERLYF